MYQTFNFFQVNWFNKNGFVATIDDIKVYFFYWHVPFLKEVIQEDGIRLADKEDIGAMKLEAITTRKEKKDFIDISFLLKSYHISTLLSAHKMKYPFISTKFVIKSLLAVDYADNTEQPKMLVSYHWENVKSVIVKTVDEYLNSLKALTVKQQNDRIMKAEELLTKRNKKT